MYLGKDRIFVWFLLNVTKMVLTIPMAILIVKNSTHTISKIELNRNQVIGNSFNYDILVGQLFSNKTKTKIM